VPDRLIGVSDHRIPVIGEDERMIANAGCSDR
jgi:hypothetical protein